MGVSACCLPLTPQVRVEQNKLKALFTILRKFSGNFPEAGPVPMIQGGAVAPVFPPRTVPPQEDHNISQTLQNSNLSAQAALR